MLQVDSSVIELTYNWRRSHLRVMVDDMPEDIIAMRDHLRDVFDAKTFEVVHVSGVRYHKGKMWGMKPADRARLRAMRKISHNHA